MPFPVAIPFYRPCSLHHRARQIAADRRYAPCGRSRASRRSVRDALHCRTLDQNVTVLADSDRVTDQTHEGVSRLPGIAPGAGVTCSARAIQFARGYARKPDPRSFLAPDGTVAVPDRYGSTGERRACGNDSGCKGKKNWHSIPRLCLSRGWPRAPASRMLQNIVKKIQSSWNDVSGARR